MMTSQKAFTIDTPLVDWLTLTSFEPAVHGMFQHFRDNIPGKLVDGVKRQQYIGWHTSNELGGIFCGYGVQDGREHWMTQVEGELCNEDYILNFWAQGTREGWLATRRLDLQATIVEPAGWSQWAQFNRIKKRNLAPGWHESTDRDGNTLATCYAYPRTSGKFLRVYQKMAGQKLLRCEFELKRNAGQTYANAIIKGKETVGSMFMMLLHQFDDKKLLAAFLPRLDGFKPGSKPKLIVKETNTERWLLEQVLPSFRRHINEHGNDSSVAFEFMNALLDAGWWSQ